MQDKLKQGIDAVRRGDKVNAVKLLRQVTDREPNNEVAWMWLASALDNLSERRAALEQALRINPGNARAQEALRQISNVLPPAPTKGGTARRATTGYTPSVTEGRGGILLIVVGSVVALAVIAAIIFNVISSSQPTPTQLDATRAVEQSSLLTSPTPLPTIDPDTYTATPFYGVIVTPGNLPTFPPEFTPTFTVVVPTPLPSPTPYPLSVFELVFTSLNGSDAQPALFRAAGDGSGEQQIGAGSDGYSDVAYSPDGAKIAFVRTVTYAKDDGTEVTAPELFVAPVDNLSAARQVTKIGGTSLEEPTWAPDSIQIVFVTNVDGDDDLFYITEDGNNMRPVTVNDFKDRDPAWSPDGTLIAFASEQANAPGSGQLEIFTTTPDGATLTQLTDDANSSYSPAWSPDGGRITFASDRSGDGDIFIMGADGQRQMRLTVDDGDAEDLRPIFTPGGQSIAFLSNREGDAFQLFQVDLEGRTVVRLLDSGRDIQSFSYRPAFLR